MPVKMLLAAVLVIVTVWSTEAATVTKQKAINVDAISFPVDDLVTAESRPANRRAVIENRFGEDGVHQSCKKQTFCTIMPPDYPEDKFNNMFKDYKIPPMPTVEVIGNRQGDPSYESGCETLPTFEPLYKVRPKRDEDAWRTVVQAPSHDYIQRVRLETCLTTGSCFKPLLDTNPQIETACVQMYTAWDLLVEAESGNGTERIKVELPTCCSCKYKEIKFLSRFADTAKANKTKA